MNETPKEWPPFWRLTRFFWIALLVCGTAFFAEKLHQDRSAKSIDTKAVEGLVSRELMSLQTQVSGALKSWESDKEMVLHPKNDVSIYVFKEDTLLFWSGNSIALPINVNPNSFKNSFVRLPNIFGLSQVDSSGLIKVVGIKPIQYVFPFENEFLSNNFLLGGAKFRHCRLTDYSAEAGQVVHGPDEQAWFKVLSDEGSNYGFIWILSISLYVLGILSLLLFMLDLFKAGYGMWKSPWWIVFLFVDLIFFRWILSFFSLPRIFFEGNLFDLFDQAIVFFESQGEALICLVFLLFFSFVINKYWKIIPNSIVADKISSPRTLDGFTAVAWIVISGLWFCLFRFWVWLLNQSGELLEIHNILSLTQSDFVNLFLVGLSGSVFLFVLFSVVRQTSKVYPPLRFALVPIVIGMIFFSITRYSGYGPDLISLLCLLILIISCSLSYYGKRRSLSQISLVLILFFSSVYIIQFLDRINEEKNKSIQTEMIGNLANEHDEIAEMLLLGMDEEIVQDTVLFDMIRDPKISEDIIKTYVLNRRFGPYWSRYELNVNVCDSVNPMSFSTGTTEVICLPYWNEIVSSKGQKLGDSHFYYIDNFDGVIWYTGVFPVFSKDSSYAYHLIINAESVLVSEGVGYPDVLIAGEDKPSSIRESYSYARYQGCKLISRSGEYNYSSSCESYPSIPEEIVHFELDGYHHWINELDGTNRIVLSKKKTTFFNHVISFSYLFVSFYLVWLIISSLIILPRWIRRGGLDLKSKIQISMVGTLMVSFLLIGGGMSYFIVNQYDNTNRSTINEKIQSVLIELNHKLELEDQITPEWSGGDYPNLQALLVKFSFVFKTDINLYSPEGSLLATSRPEVFRKNLTGRYMDPQAFHDLATLNRMELIQRENIGSMGYWSAYVPFYNYEKKLMAYLNLPYFSKQSDIREEVSTFLVAMFNGYLLLILLAVFIAVVLGNQLTKPLQLLQERFSGMHLRGGNREFEYHRNDEIGGLVKAYNQMVMELENSAEMLAKSERESAWREMAKQIAHEIKNPLTPMKLSIQHLKRSWDDKVEDWDAHLDRVSKTLVEQIDSLTAIANEFSQFAKMPRAKREEIDLVVKVENTIALFKQSDVSEFKFEVEGEGPFIVFLDKEQILQVLNNLMTNAVQSIPAGRTPDVYVHLVRMGSKVRLSVKDNGSGIAEELRDKLFQPNFTTKSSGMGLGLAISKNIIDNSDGSIWFETGDEGTTFFVELPLV